MGWPSLGSKVGFSSKPSSCLSLTESHSRNKFTCVLGFHFMHAIRIQNVEGKRIEKGKGSGSGCENF